LVDVAELDLADVVVSFLEAKRTGTTKSAGKGKLSTPRPGGDPATSSNGGVPAADRAFTDREREDLALAIVAAAVAQNRGWDLEDIRDQSLTGADARDPKAGVWVELKTHLKDLPDSVRLERSEAERAAKEKGKYVLALVWNLEHPRVPRVALIADPMKRLDADLIRGMRLTGLRDLAEMSAINIDE
jgi:hypothetical protein